MIATHFSVATHIMLLMTLEPASRLTSPRLAGSVNTNPVVVRRIMRLLSHAGLVRVRRGQGGAALGRPPSRISLDDVWLAVNPVRLPLLPLHANPDPECPVGRHVPSIFGERFGAAEIAMRDALAAITLEAIAMQISKATKAIAG